MVKELEPTQSLKEVYVGPRPWPSETLPCIINPVTDPVTPREHGLTFASELIAPIMDGTKTQTRRVIVPRNSIHRGKCITKKMWHDMRMDDAIFHAAIPHGFLVPIAPPEAGDQICITIDCKYAPGDLIWVREPITRGPLEQNEALEIPAETAVYVADGEPVISLGGVPLQPKGSTRIPWWKSRSLHALYMPKWACRTWLRVVSVRPECVQEISSNDIGAEGIRPLCHAHRIQFHVRARYLEKFADLWDRSTKRKDNWLHNPWVWRIEFELAERPKQ